MYPSPIIYLVQNLPEVAQIVMDNSITSAQLHPTNPKYRKHYDFKYILDMPTDTADTKQLPTGLFLIILCYLKFLFSLDNSYNAEPLNVIRTMIKYKRRKLFTHPLLLTFLNVKWLKYGRLYIQIRAGVLMLLTFLLSLLIGISDPPRKNIGTTEQLNATIDHDGYIPNALLIIILITDFFYALVIILQIFFFIKL